MHIGSTARRFADTRAWRERLLHVPRVELLLRVVLRVCGQWYGSGKWARQVHGLTVHFIRKWRKSNPMVHTYLVAIFYIRGGVIATVRTDAYPLSTQAPGYGKDAAVSMDAFCERRPM